MKLDMEHAILFGCIVLADGIKALAPKTVFVPLRPSASPQQIENHSLLCKEFDRQEANLRKGKDPLKTIKFLTDICEALTEHGHKWPRDLLENFKFRVRRLRGLIERECKEIHPA
jgi:hypothetical protein